MRLARVSVLLALVALCPIAAQADTILAPGSAWEYTFANPTANPAWNTTTGGGWAVGNAPFGNCAPGCGYEDPDFYFQTFWPADGSDGDDLWVRRSVDLTGYVLGSVKWNLGTDNGYKLYANGFLVAGHNAEGYTYQWEYSGTFAGLLNPGINVIAVALEDHGGLTAWDMEITGDPVPEPASMLLLGTGLAGLLARRRNRK